MSTAQRPMVLMAILLVLLAGYGIHSYLEQHPRDADPAPLDGRNAVTNLKIRQDNAGSWIADFDYFYTGAPRVAVLFVDLLPHPSEAAHPRVAVMNGAVAWVPPPGQPLGMAQRGQHHRSIVIAYPGDERSTRQIEVGLRDPTNKMASLVAQRVDQAIEWPNYQTWYENQQLHSSTPAENRARAHALIDAGDENQLAAAKRILERLIEEDARNSEAYVELARIAYRSNWGPEGLHQAENLLSSALQIEPDNVNARILLGYIYTHQRRFEQAQALFSEVAKSDPPNLWLWAHWGELLLMQHKTDAAIAKYRETLRHPVTHDTYDRARNDAYRNLLAIMRERKDLDSMEALYKQRVSDYGPGSCYSAEYARFMLQVRGDTQAAIDLARRALNKDCEDSESRKILGLAEYVKWAAATGPERTESLNQARIYLPAGPMPLYLLAASDLTVPAIKELIASGEQIDQKDNERQTALGYALQNGDLDAARRLLKLQARSDVPVGYEDMPIALIPVIQRNIEGVRLLRGFGVDYSKLRYRGATAIDFATQAADHALLQALGVNATSL